MDQIAVFVLLKDIIDFEQEVKRLQKEMDKNSKELVQVSNKLLNDDFLSKAPADVVEKVKEKRTMLADKQQKIKLHIEKIKEIGDRC